MKYTQFYLSQVGYMLRISVLSQNMMKEYATLPLASIKDNKKHNKAV